MPRYALTIAFAGSAFHGTQVQGKGERTLHAVLTAAAAALGGEGVRLSSRLDAGVDAEGLVGDAVFAKDFTPAALVLALNGHLPSDVAIRAAARVPDHFDATRHARTKTYRYRVLVSGVRPVLDRRVWWVRRLDHLDRLPACAASLPGTHDLSAFASLRRDGSDDDDPVRTIHAATWDFTDTAEGHLATFRITGAGFLYRQVRGLVGAMIHIASDAAPMADFATACQAGRTIFATHPPKRLGNLAPPDGLCLETVCYEPEPEWERP